MRTPINNNGCRSVIDPNVDFHAGHFLCDVLQEVGHDVAWLAQHTGRDIVFLEDLLELPNMDAELFVRIGHQMNPLFMRQVEEMILGKTNCITSELSHLYYEY